MPRWMYALLFFAVLTPILSIFRVPVPPLILFVVAGLGILPLAALIGQSVEQIAEFTGERIGGLLFATFGNATELIIGIFALSAGLVDVVRAAIIGSILGNALLVLGVATCVGSLMHGRLRFDPRPAGHYASLLALCIGGLILPAVAELLASRSKQSFITEHGILLSDFIAVLLLLGYVASILFSVFNVGNKGAEEIDQEKLAPLIGARSEASIVRLLTYRHKIYHSNAPDKSGALRQIDSALDSLLLHSANDQAPTPPNPTPATSTAQASASKEPPASKRRLWTALLLLAVVTAAVAWLSDILVGSIEPFTKALGWNAAFVGLIFVPLIGGLPEYFNTITMALDKRMGMVLAASAGSSIQIALLVAPILVLGSLFAPQRLDLVFSVVELAVLSLTAFLFSEITRDGELVWLEGLLLILLYAMMGGTVFIFGS